MRRYIRLIESLNVPNVLYHATFEGNRSSILQYGLDASRGKRNYDISFPVIYLCDDPDIAEGYAIEAYGERQDNIILLQIETAELDYRLLSLDRNHMLPDSRAYEYRGIIPPSAISIV